MISQILLRLRHRLFGHPIDTWWIYGDPIEISPGHYQSWTSRRCICGVTERLRWLTDKEIEEGDWIA